ncbi:hypothetical protein [Fimbriiglobus ruber]|uniref:hypothetical protein n=1 Tax=Fimbriiglobus ruber TaxID=1908690 RepID=UPI001EE6F5CF|nr:hypothetical protein [Fimbriiglobus ruber]
MTEAEWLVSAMPRQLVQFIPKNATERKKRLLGFGLCRRILHLVPDERSRRAVLVAERFADGAATDAELSEAGARTACRESQKYLRSGNQHQYFGKGVCFWVAGKNVDNWEIPNDDSGSKPAWEDAAEVAITDGARWHTELGAFCKLVRCVYGNPFCPVSLDRSWKTSTVLALAQSIYADRAFERLPILADALEKSGCDNLDVLNHFRSETVHTRGCWVVDLLTGRE